MLPQFLVCHQTLIILPAHHSPLMTRKYSKFVLAIK
jgi:hypothetical protein